MRTLLETVQEEFHANLILTEKSTRRDYKFPEATNIIKVAIGMRRSGKTYFLYQTIRDLLKEGLSLDHILYINFEDERILPLDAKGMGKLIDSWYTLHPDNHNHRCFLFLDEVQNIDGWALVLRRLLDSKNVQIYVTGSSAKLLSREIATSLRGRSLSVEIAPYNYPEYLLSNQLELPARPFGKKMQDQQRGHLLHYFRTGGFPAVQTMPQNEQLDTLQNYVETVIFRDIIERHKINNIPLLKYLNHSLLKNTASPFSMNKFYNDIKSQGHQASKDTLYSYLSYLEDAFLIFTVPIFTESLRQSQTNPKKIYAIDNGLIVANTFNLSENFGKLLENRVYLDLRRQNKKTFYYRTAEGYEVDFITQDREGRYEMLQVVWDADDPKTLEREERALERAKEELGIPGRMIDWSAYLQEFIKA